jgi:centromere/kinetochore protein ZW10
VNVRSYLFTGLVLAFNASRSMLMVVFLGVDAPTIAHHFEKKMVAQDKVVEPVQTRSAEVTDWDAGWDSDGKDEPKAETQTCANSASVSEKHSTPDAQKIQTNPSVEDDDDGAADAWGWGDDDDVTAEPIPGPLPVEDMQHSSEPEIRSELREMTLSEPYWISSIPKPMFDIIKGIYDDGAELTKPE